VTSIRFNPSESSVLASVGSDRTLTLYDIRTGKAERRVIMQVSLVPPDAPVLFITTHLDAHKCVVLVSHIPHYATSRL
jgi:WD40 repeat protein